MYFSCSPEDAHQLARHTMPELTEHDLSRLDVYTAAARLVVGSRETAAFRSGDMQPPARVPTQSGPTRPRTARAFVAGGR